MQTPRRQSPSRYVPLAALRCAALAPLLAAVTLAVGCATPAARDGLESGEDVVTAVSYTVRRGDRLGDIALEFTGEIERWRDIAAHNGIDDPRTLREGAVLEIPAALMPRAAAEATRRADARPVDRTRERGDATTARADAAAARRAAAAGDGERRRAPVRTSAVVVNRRFELSPLERSPDAAANGASGAAASVRTVAARDTPAATGVAATTGAETDSAAPQARRVRVIGSYFPKGIYAQPAIYSKLLMRVAPGTSFEIDRKTGDWYGVVTDQGIGYLRDDDGQVIDATDTPGRG